MNREFSVARVLCLAWFYAISIPGITCAQELAKRPVTVADTIRMTTLPENAHAAGDTSSGRFARFSPDGMQFVVVTQKGDLNTNENEFSLLLFETADAFRHPVPQVLVSMRSRSNREGIKNVKWIGDKTLYFIGEARDSAQVYSVDVTTKMLKQCTSHSTSVVDFDVDATTRAIVFAAEPGPPATNVALDKFYHGFAITTETPDDLPRTKADFEKPNETRGEDVFVEYSDEKEAGVVLSDRFMPFKPISIAPDGKHAVFAVLLRDVPPSWIDYEDELIRAEVKAFRRKGSQSWLMQYMLLDLATRATTPLLSGPVAWSTGAASWSGDGKKIAVSGAFLPLNIGDPVERLARTKRSFAVEVDVETGEFDTITSKDEIVVRWDAVSNRVFFRPASPKTEPARMVYAKTERGWAETNGPSESSEASLPQITLEQDLNTPPKLFASDASHPNKSLFLDLNPQFAELNFARVEVVHWKATDGHEVEGGLYFPIGYKAGVRYPLVIQTHAFSPKEFWIDGPWNSAFAAQPLAGQGIVVLQVGHGTDPADYMKHHRNMDEGPHEMAAFEGAVDYLDQRGMIDRQRVGIIGFSRTQYHVAYTLTHSSYGFAAATLADGFDGGYLQYIMDPYTEKDVAFVNGGPPFGSNFQTWLEHSPSFRIEKVHLPVRIECYGGGVIGCWEWFSILTHLARPVELIYLPDAPHILVKPWERMTSQQGNVDWFCFWLKGEEDRDPQKAEEYTRWRALKKLQEENEREARETKASSAPQ